MTLKYMLDTDTVSFALRGFGGVSKRLLEQKPSAICMSAITLAELRYGADHRGSRKLHGIIDTFAAGVTVVPFEEATAAQFGSVAATLVREGTPIGDFDAMIAAHALALDVTLVTNNAKHFSRVHGLRIDNWV
ncbi:MAG: type II toxin-antitoxin system VapC family toxin [Byssovorax sp.]